MSLARLAAILRKELRHIYRDPQIFFMAVLAPAFILFLLAYVFTLDTSEIRLGLLDMDHSTASREVVRNLTASGEIVLIKDCRDYGEAGTLLTRGEAGAVLVIPHGFGSSVNAGRPEPLQILLDASDYRGANTIYANLATRVQALGLSLLPGGGATQTASVVVQSRTLYNPTGKSVYAMVPGLMAAAFCFPAIAVALACTRETERGSYEGLLATPMNVAEYLLGKLLPYVAAGLLSAVLTWGVARLWFHVPFRGSLGVYFIETSLFLLALMSVSVLVGTATTVQRHAIIIVVLIFFIPTFFMSGLLAPMDPETTMAQVFKLVLPAANYVATNRAVFLKGLGLSSMLAELGHLLLIALGALIASYVLARRKVA